MPPRQVLSQSEAVSVAMVDKQSWKPPHQSVAILSICLILVKELF